ncbi:uncharacterized protein MAM_02064 [Metarhizium album ARSEF 1941]|uniref:Uncharacterized protein n=1 Tax=Metarhizium album (strain ARSEF 1941) TaxID=1081103 RepID=A0A0B2X4A7_METAS|nr:uncharacterized protein MAM_02064 [Metarhizium album ARSEF 1941]KHO00141.1 hypothetical protein MAM_02064 [Metarhizium album ARSEF 1941]
MDLPETDDVILLKGCYLEAHRSDDTALKLEGLRIALNEPVTSCLAVTIKEMNSVARRLRELANIAQDGHVYFNQARLFCIQDHQVGWIRCFDGDRVSLIMFLNSQDDCPYLLLRIYKDEKPWFSLRGAHEVCIMRQANSLQFRRWSMNTNNSKIWAKLYFSAWEDLVLTYCTFASLKARNHRTLQCAPRELVVGKEHKLFQARISDDGFDHTLYVCSDKATGGLRLHAAVGDGELRQCPVWTAFGIMPADGTDCDYRCHIILTGCSVTEQAKCTKWLRRSSSGRKVWLTDIRLFVFCKQYREHNQRKGPAGEFQINFASRRAAERFETVFYPYQQQTS